MNNQLNENNNFVKQQYLKFCKDNTLSMWSVKM